MTEIVITPEKVIEIVEANSPSTLTISKKNIAFNLPGAARLALKQGVKFKFVVKDNKLYYKDSSDGFEITGVTKGCMICNNQQIHKAFQTLYKEYPKSYKFVIGDFINGLRLLTPVE